MVAKLVSSENGTKNR